MSYLYAWGNDGSYELREEFIEIYKNMRKQKIGRFNVGFDDGKEVFTWFNG